MWELCYTHAHKKQYLGNCTFLIHIVNGLFTLEICHLSLKDSLLFNALNSFNVNLGRFQFIYWTNIV